MKTIGIKLADGSFYPVLEEGSAQQKKLDLTTAHNNQTKVMVDLYRSATCSMDDAEYVDSLQIENLNAHPTGEADISFTVELDEDNQLSANIIDSETGKESNTQITLVSRTLEERLVTDEYNISEIKDDSEANTKNGIAAGVAAGGGLLARAAAIRAEENPETDNNEITEEDFSLGDPDAEISSDEDALPDFNFDLDNNNETTETTESSEAETAAATEDNFVSDDTIASENTDIFEDTTASDDTIAASTEDAASDNTLPDFDFNLDDISDSKTEETTDNFTETSTDNIFADDPIASENTDIFDDTTASDDTTVSDESLPDFNFDMDDNNSESSADLNLDDDIFADIQNTDTSVKNTDNFADSSDDIFADDNSSDNEEIPASGGISFTGLYDKETELGESSNHEDEETSKKTKVPVIICIVCAVICVIATLLILFIIPSKYNLIGKNKTEETVVETPVVEEPVEEVKEEPAPVEEVPEAKEDEIVIVEKAEEVIPEQPPVVEETPKSITYKIHWGDTLWDIANTYYKNPWRYKYIARYNGIKDPDYIVSGTTIVIPSE